MTIFYQLLGITLISIITNNFVWFALTYWAYLTTNSVISTSTIAGIFLVVTALSGFWLGSIVDHHKKKNVLLWSSFVSAVFFGIGYLTIYTQPTEAFSSITSVTFWIFVIVLLCGTISGNLYNIAIPTLIGLVVPENRRDKSNGLYGTVTGLAFGINSVISGLALAYGGMSFVLAVATISTVCIITLLLTLRVDEKKVIHTSGNTLQKIDLRGTIRAIKNVPGLFPLIFFTTFNNFLGGVFMALMDAYGLTLVSVQVWGFLWGALSIGFILGGMYIAKNGLGSSPLRTLFYVNIILWIVCIFFTIQPSIVLLVVGLFFWLFLVPFVEATEQTIFQKVVPPERLGRVFGFAHSVEQAASPFTAFFIGPIAQYGFIPFMTTGLGARVIGSWYGIGVGRGIALVFSVAGVIGLLVTIAAMRSKSYRLLSKKYTQ